MSYADYSERQAQAQAALTAAKFTTRKGFARANCPFCLERYGKVDRDACFAVNTRTGFYSCWRCKAKGRLGLDAVAADVEMALADAPVSPSAQLPPEYTPLGDEPGLSAQCTLEARAYLHSRGFSDPALWRVARIGCCLEGRYAGRVIVPVVTGDGALLGFIGRTWVNDSRKPYLNASGMALGPCLYNERVLTRYTPEPALCVEGVFDVLPFYERAVAFLGKPKDEQVDALAQAARPIAVVLDGDAWQEARGVALHLRLAGQRAGYVRLPPRIDPDEVDRDWLFARAEACLDEEI